MDETKDIFEQDLSGEYTKGLVFAIQLLMKEKCTMPDEDTMAAIMRKHLGDVDVFTHSPECAGFTVKKYTIPFEEKEANPMLMLTGCCDFNSDNIDTFKRSQLWDCPDHDAILSECKYQVVATDMLGGALEAADRADMLMDYLEALVEMFPDCEAVYFQNSEKMFTADAIREHQVPRKSRFIYFAVNVRFFNISGGSDKLVDTLGMSVLCMPDLQYHFHDIDPNHVVNHAYNMLSYIFENNCPIKNNDTIDGIENGSMSMNVQWKCHYEEALIQPPREVIDICMNEFASGKREY